MIYAWNEHLKLKIKILFRINFWRDVCGLYISEAGETK